MRHPFLSLLFLLVVVPAGLIARLVKDPMARRPDPRAASYWIPSNSPVTGRKDATR
ncbi:hypothetical protein ACIRD8_17955 [Streptomyces sp. NPDC102451]|uniref:hypothetical protein n=1 Tax=Streptomyces sp. NPDC102451 TaxID=3366177 RepID=UPI0038151C52